MEISFLAGVTCYKIIYFKPALQVETKRNKKSANQHNCAN